MTAAAVICLKLTWESVWNYECQITNYELRKRPCGREIFIKTKHLAIIGQFEDLMMHEGLWKQVLELDRSDTAERALCSYDADSDCFTLVMLNCEYLVDVEKRGIFRLKSDADKVKTGFIEQLCILSYLIKASLLAPSNRLVKAESLVGGAFFFRGPHVLPTGKLEDAFGADPTLLYKCIERLGGKKCDFGDASIELQVLPRVKLTFVIWRGDDEFPGRASILFDKKVSEQLALDALGAMVNLAVDRLKLTCRPV